MMRSQTALVACLSLLLLIFACKAETPIEETHVVSNRTSWLRASASYQVNESEHDDIYDEDDDIYDEGEEEVDWFDGEEEEFWDQEERALTWAPIGGRGYGPFGSCRCPYPLENPLRSISGELVLPRNHPSCRNVKYICPGDPLNGPLWQCPLRPGGMMMMMMRPPRPPPIPPRPPPPAPRPPPPPPPSGGSKGSKGSKGDSKGSKGDSKGSKRRALENQDEEPNYVTEQRKLKSSKGGSSKGSKGSKGSKSGVPTEGKGGFVPVPSPTPGFRPPHLIPPTPFRPQPRPTPVRPPRPPACIILPSDHPFCLAPTPPPIPGPTPPAPTLPVPVPTPAGCSCDICRGGNIIDENKVVTISTPQGTETATCGDWFLFGCTFIDSSVCSVYQGALDAECCMVNPPSPTAPTPVPPPTPGVVSTFRKQMTSQQKLFGSTYMRSHFILTLNLLSIYSALIPTLVTFVETAPS